jgi:hypothetical protein
MSTDNDAPVEQNVGVPEHLVDSVEPSTVESTDSSGPDDSKETPTIPLSSTNVTQDNPARTRLTDENRSAFAGREYANILNVDVPTFNTLTESMANVEPSENWVDAVNEARQLFHRGNALFDTIHRVGSDWRQNVQAGTTRLAAGIPKLGEQSTKASAKASIMRIRALTGQGNVISVPLWHSGIWISLQTPTQNALLELDQQLATSKVELGRVTNGLLFSNDSVMLNTVLVNFVLRHVYDCSVSDSSPENLKRLILSTDIPTLIWALARSIWLNGFKYRSPCIVTPEKCSHIHEDVLNIGRLFYVDNAMLSEEQIRHMAQRRDKYTEESILKYQADHRYNNAETTTVSASDVLRFKLRVPSIEQYIISGNLWINGIRTMLESSFAVDLSERERANYMLAQGSVTALQQYAHWVDHIAVDNGSEDEVYDDPTVIAEMMADFTKDPEFYTKLMNSISKFIDASTLALVAIPAYACDKCGAAQGPVDERHPHLIPLEVNRLFFTLLSRRLLPLLSLL